MAPPKKQKKEYTTGDIVWVKVKGWPVWPGQVEDIKNVTNESVIKKKRKNAILIKFLENGTYSWAAHDEVYPFQKETFEDFMITSQNKYFKLWKKAFKLCGEEAGVDETEMEDSIKSAAKSKKKRGRDSDSEGGTPKKRKSSTSPSRGNSPKRTSRHASSGGKKKSPKRSPKRPTKKKITIPPLEATENLLREFLGLLTKYEKEEDSSHLHQLLLVISHFNIPDAQLLESVKIGEFIKNLNSKETKTHNLAQKIVDYYDSLTAKEEEEEEEKEDEEKKENGDDKDSEKEKDLDKDKDNDDDIIITETPKDDSEKAEDDSKKPDGATKA